MTSSEETHEVEDTFDETPQERTDNEGVEPVSAPSGSSEDSFEQFEQDLGDDPLVVKLQGELEAVKDDLARARADTYNVQQEYARYVRRAKETAGERRTEGQMDVIEAILPVLDDVAAARSAGELADGPFAAIAEKLESVLGTGYGYEQFGEVGEPFDPERHEALMMQPNPDADVDVQVVGQVLQPGYKVGDRVLRAAKVLVFDPQ